MLAVALVALIMGIGIEGRRRRSRFEELAGKHYILSLPAPPAFIVDPGNPAHHIRLNETEMNSDLAKRRFTYHARLCEKYRRAARYPWLPVEADPPEPE
jgi:hypothetical protein